MDFALKVQQPATKASDNGQSDRYQSTINYHPPQSRYRVSEATTLTKGIMHY